MVSFNAFVDWYYQTKQGLAAAFGQVFSLRFVQVYLAAFVLLETALYAAVRFIATSVGQERIALHYNVDFGIDLYDRVGLIYTIPAIGAIFMAVNLILLLSIGGYQKREVRFLGHLLLATAVFSCFLLLLGVASLYMVNLR